MIDDIPFENGFYSPPQTPYSELPPGYSDRPINYPVFEERDHFLLTVHGFDAGGFEAAVRQVDLQAMADAKMRPRGPRKPVEERDERDMVEPGQ